MSFIMMILKRDWIPPTFPKGLGLSRVVGGPFPSFILVYISNLKEPKTLKKIRQWVEALVVCKPS